MTSIHTDLLGCETRYVQTQHYRTRLIEIDNGKTPLILLHGGGGHAETYSRNMRRLAEVSRPIAIDFIWHGLSSAPDWAHADPKRPGHWLSQFTDQLLQLLDHLGIEKAVIEGESLGGWIAYDMAINHPDRTRAVVLNTTWGMALDPARVMVGHVDLDALRQISVSALTNPSKALIRKRLEWLMPLGGVTEELVDIRYALWTEEPTRSALIEYYQRLFSANIADFYHQEAAIRSIRCPTLVLWTDRNPIHGVDAAHRLGELITDAEVVVLENAAHWPQWEHPEKHDAAVMAFISRLSDRAQPRVAANA
jgi:pimeloyl-ACP methyl ester carboxylesterase